MVPSPAHPEGAVLLMVLAAVSAASIHRRSRFLSGVLFMLAGAVGNGTPLPKDLSDLVWGSFLAPTAYVLWMLIFRMNKQQKDWIAKHGPAPGTAGSARSARGAKGTKYQPAPTRQARGARSRRSTSAPVITATGRPLPAGNGRYTPPRARSKSSQRKP